MFDINFQVKLIKLILHYMYYSKINMNTDDDESDFKNYLGKSITHRHRGVKEVLQSLIQTPVGIHQLLVYPHDIEALREVYFHYIMRLLENNNDIVMFLPFHETAESVKNVLSSLSIRDGVALDLNKYIDNGILTIIDSDTAFSSHINNIKQIGDVIDPNKKNIHNNNGDNFYSLVRMSLSHAKKLGKDNLTIMADYGPIYNHNKKNRYGILLDFEKSIPYFFEDIKIRQICLYSEKYFFEKFNKQQEKNLIDLHSRSIIMTRTDKLK